VNPPHIHYPGDGRLPREVFLNGERIEHVVYADEKLGKVVVFRWPLQLQNYLSGDTVRQRILRHTIYGNVFVRVKEA
jgi:hypothetical protein